MFHESSRHRVMRPFTVLPSAVRALVPVREIVDGKLAELGPAARIERHEVLTTDEGEPAVVVFLRSAEVETSVGIVFGDDSCHVISEVRSGPRETWASAARTRLLQLSLGLSPTRPRRYYYRSPAQGWQAFAEGLETTWIADDGTGKIVAYPAQLETGAQPGMLPVEDSFEVRLTTKNGFTGTLTMHEDDAGDVIEVAVLTDGRFAYTLRFEATVARLAEHRRCFEDLIESIALVPVGRAALVQTFDHWVQ